jgi:hypothetical protein
VSSDDIIKLICERVAEALKKRNSVMTDDHASLWVDYQNHLTEGWSLVESLLMEHIESLIQLELEKLPRPVQKALWWDTEQGSDAMSDATWCYEQSEPFDADLGNPADDEMLQALTDLILGQLSSKAEQEASEREIAEEEQENEDNDKEENE